MSVLILGSSNVMSMSHRRPSGAKLHSLAVEAPMTKVINIILAAQENSPLYIAQALDKVCFWRTYLAVCLHRDTENNSSYKWDHASLIRTIPP